MYTRKRVKYKQLGEVVDIPDSTKETKQQSKPSEDEYYDDQFEDNVPIKPPVRSIALAVILFLVGSGLLTVGSLMLAGVIGKGEGGKASPLLIIGAVCFLPGFYNVRTAYYAWRGGCGFSYADIPSYNEDDD